MLAKGLEATEASWPEVRIAFGWVRRLATVLANKRGLDAATVRRRYRGVIAALARHFVARHGAPDLAAARAVAAEEIAFAASLCEHKVGTLLTLFRQHGPDGVVEQFATVTRNAPAESAGPEFGQPLDLRALAQDRA